MNKNGGILKDSKTENKQITLNPYTPRRNSPENISTPYLIIAIITSTKKRKINILNDFFLYNTILLYEFYLLFLKLSPFNMSENIIYNELLSNITIKGVNPFIDIIPLKEPITSKIYYKKEFAICNICLCSCKNSYRPLSCFHYYCKACLLSWSKIKNTCPIYWQKFYQIITKDLINNSNFKKRNKAYDKEVF